jgi:hypothetical protein
MKSSYALILAIGLGSIGAALNAYYLYEKSRAVETVGFVGIAPDVTINPGEPLLQKHLVEVPVPEKYASSLESFAIRYEDVGSVNRPAARILEGGSLLLEQDLETPPQKLILGENDYLHPVNVDSQSLVPSLINPGDEIFFLAAGPTVASEVSGGSSMLPAGNRGGSEGSPTIIGPFTIVTVGNRLGRADVMRTARVRQVQENVINVKFTIKDGKLQPPAGQLLDLLERTNSRPLGYIWRPQPSEAERTETAK